MCQYMIHIMVKFPTPSFFTFRDTIFYPLNFNANYHIDEEIFLECSWYFSKIGLHMFYIMVKFHATSLNTFRNMNLFLVNFNTN